MAKRKHKHQRKAERKAKRKHKHERKVQAQGSKLFDACAYACACVWPFSQWNKASYACACACVTSENQA